jgi:hypothetical protein
MFRYLTQAFWARPRIGILGRIPINALAVAGAFILGFGEHAVWLGALGVETLYLYALGTNPKFQRWVAEQNLARLTGDTEDVRQQLMRSLGGAARQRVIRIQEKIAKIEGLYRESRSEEFLFDSNRDVLQKLMWAYLKLLVAQRNLQNLGHQTTEDEINAQIAAIEKELKGNVTGTLRDSKTATLNILRQRLRNLQRRTETLAEIDADLARVEAQIDLALEQASLKDRPTAISANIDLVSHMLDDDYASELGETTQIEPRRELEN